MHGFFNCFQGFDVGIMFDLVGIMYGDDLRFVKGDGDFIHNVPFEKGIVQLGLSTHVKGETAYLTPHIPVFGSSWDRRQMWSPGFNLLVNSPR